MNNVRQKKEKNYFFFFFTSLIEPNERNVQTQAKHLIFVYRSHGEALKAKMKGAVL